MASEQNGDRSGRLILQRSLRPRPVSPWAQNGYPTCLGQPMCVTWEDLDAAAPAVAIVGVPWDGSMGASAGTRYGPMAIRTAEYTGDRGGDSTHPVSRVNPLSMLGIVDSGDVLAVHGAIEETFADVWLSVDIDVCDSALAPGTGAPGPGGLTRSVLNNSSSGSIAGQKQRGIGGLRPFTAIKQHPPSGELLRSIRRVMTVPKVRGMDLVEVSPPYESGTDITAVWAHRVVLEVLTGLAIQRQAEADENYDG
jgi:arginase family enzyme